MEPVNRRITGFDGLRGILALSVMFYHASISATLVDRTYLLGPAAVVAFFVLSGVVLSIKPLKNPAEFRWLPYYAARSIRLIIPVVVAILVTIGLDIINHFTVNIPNDQSLFNGDIAFNVVQNFDLLFHLSYGGTVDIALNPTSFVNTAVWSMPWEFLFSFLLPLYILGAHLLLKDGKSLRCCVVVCLTLIIIAIGCTVRYYPMVYLPIFFLGVAVSRVRFDKPWPILVEIVVLLLAIFCFEAQVLFADFWMSIGLYYSVEVLFALAAVLLVVLVKSGGLLNWFLSLRFLRWLGTVSFSLYLIHLPVFYGLHGVLVIVGVPGNSILALILTVAGGLIAAALFYHLIEKPSHKASQKAHALITRRIYGET